MQNFTLIKWVESYYVSLWETECALEKKLFKSLRTEASFEQFWAFRGGDGGGYEPVLVTNHPAKLCWEGIKMMKVSHCQTPCGLLSASFSAHNWLCNCAMEGLTVCGMKEYLGVDCRQAKNTIQRELLLHKLP